MKYTAFTLYISLLALVSVEVASASVPPACLLACVNKISQETNFCSDGMQDISCYCSKESTALYSCLNDICPSGQFSKAWSSLESTCS
ncbi:hypothetical protein HANVADRAFT_4224, partial [Hanseniaspora valbyensis NRRL Y-1626]